MPNPPIVTKWKYLKFEFEHVEKLFGTARTPHLGVGGRTCSDQNQFPALHQSALFHED